MTFNAINYRTLFIVGVLLALLSACKSKEQDQAEGEAIAALTLTTTTYNYTKYELYDVSFMDVNDKFDIEAAAPGGSVFFLQAGKSKLDDGTEITYDGASCCFFWKYKPDDKVKLRVIWNVIFDLKRFYGDESRIYDKRNTKLPQPGTMWCEEIVEVRKPFPAKLDTFYLHFFPDGTVAAHLSENGKLATNFPVSGLELKQHSTPLPPTEFCRHYVDNPWNGIPQRPRIE